MKILSLLASYCAFCVIILAPTTCKAVSMAAPSSTIVSTQTTEHLKYDVYWHWGFIWKKAGAGTLKLDNEKLADGSQRYVARVAGRSLSFVESIMKVRDTLYSYMTPNYHALEYAKLTHEGSYHAVERNYYTYKLKNNSLPLNAQNLATSNVEIRRWRKNKGNDKVNLSVDAPSFDMLSIFFVLRNVNYSAMKKGDKFKYPIFSGVKMTWMYAEYKGMEQCEMKNGSKKDSYRLELYFQSKDDDHTPLHVWFGTDKGCTPLKVIIQLKRIGAIQAELVGNV